MIAIVRTGHRPQHILIQLFVLLLLALTTACAEGQATNQPKIPLAGRVTDAADIIDAAQEANLTRHLEELERRTGHQMVVVTVSSLEGEEVDSFTQELGNAWGIGRAEHNDGVILLVAPNERKVRIAVGYGLEETLSDEACKKIVEDKILPHFRLGNLSEGIEAGVNAVIGLFTQS
jgi:uncharacterized protein